MILIRSIFPSTSMAAVAFVGSFCSSSLSPAPLPPTLVSEMSCYDSHVVSPTEKMCPFRYTPRLSTIPDTPLLLRVFLCAFLAAIPLTPTLFTPSARSQLFSPPMIPAASLCITVVFWKSSRTLQQRHRSSARGQVDRGCEGCVRRGRGYRRNPSPRPPGGYLGQLLDD